MTNAEGESTITVQDGAGRTVMMIDGEGHITTRHYDTLETAANLALGLSPDITLPGDLLSTKTIDGNGNANINYTDGGGRTLVHEDGIGSRSGVACDANSNYIVIRDENGLGENCIYDSLDRKTSCADLQEQLEAVNRTWTYNAHNAVLTTTDAEGHTATNVYDVRDRLTDATDRNNLTTSYGWG